MYAVEFDAKINEGAIKIPNKYVNRLGEKVKVIILSGEEEKNSVFSFDSVRINTKGFKFDREVANER